MDAPPATPQERHDDAMHDFSRADYPAAIAKLTALLADVPDHFDAQLALGMAWHRLGDHARALAEGHKAERLRPQEQLVHTNLSLFYMKAGDRKTAEHHGLQARLASWRGNPDQPPSAAAAGEPELRLAGSAPPAPVKLPPKFAHQPWKKNPPAAKPPPAG
jgi:predicted Zn-dependent protease